MKTTPDYDNFDFILMLGRIEASALSKIDGGNNHADYAGAWISRTIHRLDRFNLLFVEAFSDDSEKLREWRKRMEIMYSHLRSIGDQLSVADVNQIDWHRASESIGLIRAFCSVVDGMITFNSHS